MRDEQISGESASSRKRGGGAERKMAAIFPVKFESLIQLPQTVARRLTPPGDRGKCAKHPPAGCSHKCSRQLQCQRGDEQHALHVQ